MTDHDALVRAICEQPDDDTPRLIYADFLDENGESSRAEFVRAQIELARTPTWDPFAVLCRHRHAGWSEVGGPFRAALPDLPAGWNLAWHERAFRRGLGWRAVIGSLFAWDELAPQLFSQAPIGEVHLKAPATLDDWRRFTTAEWMRHLRVVHLEAGSPVEPVRMLCESPTATGITDLCFHVSTSMGLPELTADLFETRFGMSLRGLYFRMGTNAVLEDLIYHLPRGETQLRRLKLELMGFTPDVIERWCDRRGVDVLAPLTELDLRGNYAIGNEGIRALTYGLRRNTALQSLGLSKVGMADDGLRALAGCTGLSNVRMLDLSQNRFTSRSIWALADSETLAGTRSLNLSQCRLGDQAVRRLTRAHFWKNLVELDLRDNPISDPGVRHLVKAPLPPDLTALLLDSSPLSPSNRAALRDHFGERVMFASGDQKTA